MNDGVCVETKIIIHTNDLLLCEVCRNSTLRIRVKVAGQSTNEALKQAGDKKEETIMQSQSKSL